MYHTSDLHDHRGVVPELCAIRAKRPGFLFDCGDSLRGSQTVYHRREPILGELAAAGYDAQAMGNREFHYFFSAVEARARHMRHPLLCSNLIDTFGRALPFRSSLVLTEKESGAVLHLLGLLIPQYAPHSFWERIFGWRFMDPFETVRRYAADVPKGDALIVLSHIGLSLDRRLAAAVPRIDLILGGHSHDTLAQPEVVAKVPILHAGAYGAFVSSSQLSYDSSAQRWAIRDFALLPLLK
ncbi:MAG: hypothetical protein M3Z14_07580 [Candidatus Eremiobacteraeota bacterium]|nr:hypothetical protein [Candidatus Eremiobacteraeota bacterium]